MPSTLHLQASDLKVDFRPGNTLTLILTWPTALTGRTFTATLGGVPITVLVSGSDLTVSATAAQTAAAAPTLALVDFVLTETTVTPQVIIAGRWLPTLRGTPSPSPTTVTVTVGQATVPVSVVGTLGGPAGGVLAGVYPNPTFAQDMATQVELAALAAPMVMLDETGNLILDQAGEAIVSQFAVGLVDLAFDPATQVELNAESVAARASILDVAGDVLAVASLSVMVDENGGFVLDQDGNLIVSSAAVGIADLAFDPATQAELNAETVRASAVEADNAASITLEQGRATTAEAANAAAVTAEAATARAAESTLAANVATNATNIAARVARTGDTMTGPLVLPGDPTQAAQAATKNYVDNSVGIGLTPDATTTTKGKVKLAGDLAGTADLPTVPGLAAKATDTAVVHVTGAETVAGVKTFSSAPVVPAASFPESAVTNLVADLAALTPLPAVKAKVANYTALYADVVLCDASAGAFTVTLPAAATGKAPITVKKTDSSVNAVTISPTAGTIDGAATMTITLQYRALTFVSDGTNQFVV